MPTRVCMDLPVYQIFLQYLDFSGEKNSLWRLPSSSDSASSQQTAQTESVRDKIKYGNKFMQLLIDCDRALLPKQSTRLYKSGLFL